ncbi:hypothetical protein [Vagococcus luciliae]|uniref:Tagatose-6-phosphate kinase n=1 Tax=Vagococcus luciliae TaxID=2920380 RepID=A0ABY5NX13_9ENTE|nr:hypothetical protein [Vagococcus luciliae]UUV98021.1 Tagatose-6-phosphate kinase [Vagococcus luciliae]
MIVTVNLYPEVSKRMQAKINLEQRVVTHLKPIIGEVETLVLLDNMTTHINNLFQQEFSSISNVLYSRDIYDYQEVIDGSDAIILFSDSLVNKRNSYYSFFHLLQNNQKIIFDGSIETIKIALNGDDKPYAICLKETQLPDLLSLSQTVVSNMLPSEIITDPLFEDVPMVVIYGESGTGYVSHNEELFSLSTNDLDVSNLSHEGFLFGLARGLSDKENTTEVIVKQGLICAISSIDKQDVIFDEHYFDDKINVVKIA